MSIAVILEIIAGVLAFPKEVRTLILLLRKTPAEKRDELMSKMRKEADLFEETGRPTWD